MAKEYKLEVQKRESGKKSDLKKYRKDGMIPGIYYSHNSKNSINFLVSQTEINQLNQKQIFLLLTLAEKIETYFLNQFNITQLRSK